MQGVEGQIFSPMARTYAYALIGSLLATFTVTPCLASLLLPADIHDAETVAERAMLAACAPALPTCVPLCDFASSSSPVPWGRGWAPNSPPRWRKSMC